MVQDGILRREGPWLKLPGHAVRLTVTDKRLWVRIEQILECARFQPPRVRYFARRLGSREEEVRRSLRRLTQMGRLIEVAHDHFFTRDRVVELAGGHTSSRRAQSERQDHRGGFPRSHRYRTKISDTDPRVLRPNRHDYSRGDLRRLRENRPESLKGAGD
jgi:hypothetical protein